MLVKQNEMWRLEIRSTIILVGSMNHLNIYIRILTMSLPGQLFVLHQKLTEHEKISKQFNMRLQYFDSFYKWYYLVQLHSNY